MKPPPAAMRLAETDLVNAEDSWTEAHVGFERLMGLIYVDYFDFRSCRCWVFSCRVPEAAASGCGQVK
jgi:hypothetical protein